MTDYQLNQEFNLNQQLTLTQQFNKLATDERLANTVAALEANGMNAIVVENGSEARRRVLEMIPAGSYVHNPPSRTLEQIGLKSDIEASTSIQNSRSRLHALDKGTQQHEMRRLASSPDIVVGSVQAITEQGQVLLASATGSQMAAAVFGADKVIWVAGTQKLVPSIDEGFRRIREYSLLLEDERTRKAYGQSSAANKLLVVNAEQPGRITMVLVKENLGF